MRESSLVFAFIDGSDSYVHGYEAGLLAAKMEAAQSPILSDLPYHTANIPQFELMARHYGYQMEERHTDFGEWTYLAFTKGPDQ